MELLDLEQEQAKPHRINWLGKAFYIGELLLVLCLILVLSDVIDIKQKHFTGIFFSYYMVGGSLFVLFSRAFLPIADKLCLLAQLSAFSLMPLQYYFKVFSSKEGRLVMLTIITLVSAVTFGLLLYRLVKDRKATNWHYIGMLVRVGLLLLPLTIALLEKVMYF